MLKSKRAIRNTFHFAFAFVLAWPAIILFTGPHLIYHFTKLTDRCEHFQTAVYRAMFEVDEIETTTFVIGRKEFINTIKRNSDNSTINQFADSGKIIYVEIGILNLPAVSRILKYLGDKRARALIFESHPTVWTDFEPQFDRRQEYLDILEDGYSAGKFYSIIQALVNVASSDCKIKMKLELPQNIYSASFLMNFESIYLTSKIELMKYSQSTPLFWVHDENYYANQLLGSPDTLTELRELPRTFQGVLGTFLVL